MVPYNENVMFNFNITYLSPFAVRVSFMVPERFGNEFDFKVYQFNSTEIDQICITKQVSLMYVYFTTTARIFVL